MTKRDDDGLEQFERVARDAFDASIDELDAPTLSRLNQSRQRAVAAAAGDARPAANRWLMWVPVGALTAGVLAAALLLRTSPGQPGLANAPEPPLEDSMEVLVAGDDLALAAEADLDFFVLVELEADSAGDAGSAT